MKFEEGSTEVEKSHFLLPLNYKLTPKQPASQETSIKLEEDENRPKPFFPTAAPATSAAMRIQSRASSVSSTGRDILKQPLPRLRKSTESLLQKRNSVELKRSSSDVSTRSSVPNLRNSLPPSESRASTPGATAATQPGALDGKEKEALQHIILASLRLRGISRSADNDFYKEIYASTFQAARFALRQQKLRLQKKGDNVAKIGMMDMQDKVDKLLNLFMGEESVSTTEGF